MKALIVGYGLPGSIGERHERLLKELGCETAVVSAHAENHPHCFRTLATALERWWPDYVVITNRTSDHYATVKALAEARFNGRVLIEKPLFDASRPCPAMPFSHAAVAYNFRCHPLVQSLIQQLGGEDILEASLHVGQWLPDWRPSRDYRTTSSAKRAEGGGVLRDLSHELDLALHMFGPWSELTAAGGHFSDLAIETEDTYALQMRAARCPSVNVTMNYLDKPARRKIVAKTKAFTLSLDLIAGVIEKDGAQIEHRVLERDYTYREQHRAMIEGQVDTLCSIAEGLAVVDLIAAAEKANATRTPVHRPAA